MQEYVLAYPENTSCGEIEESPAALPVRGYRTDREQRHDSYPYELCVFQVKGHKLRPIRLEYDPAPCSHYHPDRTGSRMPSRRQVQPVVHLPIARQPRSIALVHTTKPTAARPLFPKAAHEKIITDVLASAETPAAAHQDSRRAGCGSNFKRCRNKNHDSQCEGELRKVLQSDSHAALSRHQSLQKPSDPLGLPRCLNVGRQTNPHGPPETGRARHRRQCSGVAIHTCRERNPRPPESVQQQGRRRGLSLPSRPEQQPY